MCELQWYALAEIRLKRPNDPQEIFCLCSRVFVRDTDDSLLRRSVFSTECNSASEEESLQEEDGRSECSSLPQFVRPKPKQELDPETVSCYYSASHTDTLSTDEHESIRDTHEPPPPAPSLIRTSSYKLQASDSGTDLTLEYSLISNRHDVASDWQRFWSKNGEKLIWESWIGKYSAYINPDYLQYAQEQVTVDETKECAGETQANVSQACVDETKDNVAETKESTTAIRRELLSLDLKVSDVKNRVLIRNLSGSDDKINVEVSEGWNPLSPLSIDCETEIEQLLSSKCGSSLASSSLRTVDSMTNVTRMTISSIDLSESSESFSSVSSIQSSVSSSSEETNECSASGGDYHHQWNILWKKHYEDEFLRQYDIFCVTWKERNPSLESEDGEPPHSGKQHKKNIHKVFRGKVENDDVREPIQVTAQVAVNLGNILNNLKVSHSVDKEEMEEDQNSQYVEMDQMNALGLPTNFGKSRNKQKRRRESESTELASTDLNKTWNTDEVFDAARKRIKSAFSLIGIEYNDANQVPMSGQVNYKMKHIRLQNRHLRLLHDFKKPRHIHFDEDGVEIAEKSTNDDEIIDILSDSSDEQLISPDESVAIHHKYTENYEETSVVIQKKKRKKRKIILPPEIKENAHLKKYWYKRFQLFSKFDEGIKLDEESWYSVTPELIARHIAKRCKCDIIVDGFCGAGGNSIQFAQTCGKVIAIDIDPKKIELARNNAKVYGVEDRIEFIVGDFFQLAPTLRADVVFFSPPWGGPDYLKEIVYDLDTMLLPVPITELLEAGRQITENIAVFLPRNSNSFLLIDQSKPGGGVEIEQNFMKKNLVSITAYYSDLMKST